MRVFERENLQLFFGSIGAAALVLLLSSSAHAAIKGIDCKTAFGEKSFTVQESTVAFHSQKDSGRKISSVLGARTRRTHKGFRKTLYINGNKHLINIENTKSFDTKDDFLAVTSPKGHKMTYPLTCSLAL